MIRSMHRACRRPQASRPRCLPLIVGAAALIPALAGCEAGNNAPTLQWHQPTPGASAELGGITVSNVFILGAVPNSVLGRGQSAGVFFGLANTGSSDRLTGISAPGVARTVTLAAGTVNLPSRKAVLLTGPVPKAVLAELSRPLAGGTSVRLTMKFQNAGSVTLNVPVLPRATDYSTYSPPPAPQAPPPAKPTAARRRHPAATPSHAAAK